jgi:hypothetical protein
LSDAAWRRFSGSSEAHHAAAVNGIGLVLTSPFLVADLLASAALGPLLPGYRARSGNQRAPTLPATSEGQGARVFDLLENRFAEQQFRLRPATS